MNRSCNKTLLLIFLTILLITSISKGQTSIHLRDLTFTVPSSFFRIDTSLIEPKPRYRAYHDYGLFTSDSSNLESFPRISYMYIEIPGFGYDSGNTVLTRLNKDTDQKFHYDTISISSDGLISIGRFKLINYTVYESKMLGRLGWLDIFYYSENGPNQKDYNDFLSLIHSVKFNDQYVNHKENETNDSKLSTFLFIGSFILFLIVYLLRRLLKT